jgi:DNA-binding GntR family transcriptional regulator
MTGLNAPDRRIQARRSSGEHAALLLRRLIFDGELRPGDRVPQDDVARMLGVSRIPVREALIALEQEGWVTIELHRGAFINVLDEASIRDHYDLYALVYGTAARKALQRDGEGLLHRLQQIHTVLQETSNPEEIGRCTVAFNAAVVDAAGSPRMKVLLRSMTGLVPGDFFTLVAGAVDVARSGSNAVLRALRRGDGDRAAFEYQTMMRQMGDKVVTVFRSRGLLDGQASGDDRTAASAQEQGDE